MKNLGVGSKRRQLIVGVKMKQKNCCKIKKMLSKITI